MRSDVTTRSSIIRTTPWLYPIDPGASGRERRDAKDLCTFAEYVLGPKVASETELREASNPTDVIIEEAQNHDFTSIGFPEQKLGLRKLLSKSVRETLIQKRNITVLMTRDADRTARSLYYRYRRAMENSGTNGRSE